MTQRKLVFQNNTVHILLLVSIVALGIFLRLFGANRQLSFTDDAGTYFSHLRAIAVGQLHESIVGPAASVPGWVRRGDMPAADFTHGALLGQLLFGVARLAHFQPVGIIHVWIILDIVTILAMYWAGSGIHKRVGLLAALLYSVSHWYIYFSRVPFAFALISFVAVISMGSLIRMVKGDRRFWPLFALSLTLFPHIHNVGYIYDVCVLGFLLVWRIPLPRSTRVRVFTLLGCIPIVFWDKTTLVSMIGWASQGFQTVQNFSHIGPVVQELFRFMAVALTGYPLVQPVVTWVSLVGGLVAVVVGVYSARNYKDESVKKSFVLPLVLWLIFLVCVFVASNVWFYGISVVEGYNLPSNLVALVAFLLVVAIAIDNALASKQVWRMGAACVGLFLVVASSTNATEQIVWHDRFNLLTLGAKQDILRVIEKDGVSPASVCIVNAAGEPIENFSYLWSVGPFHRDIHFLPICDKQTLQKNTWYGIFAPGKDRDQYKGDGRVIYGGHASYLVVAYP